MRIQSSAWIMAISLAAAAAITVAIAQTPPSRVGSQFLKTPAEFQSIADRAERSRAIFAEIGTVLTHPRCMNCHPAGEHTLQGADHHDHRPGAWRNDTERCGTPCNECHKEL